MTLLAALPQKGIVHLLANPWIYIIIKQCLQKYQSTLGNRTHFKMVDFLVKILRLFSFPHKRTVFQDQLHQEALLGFDVFIFLQRKTYFSKKTSISSHIKMSKYTIVPPSFNLHFMITTRLEFYTLHHYLETSCFYISHNF